MSLLIAALRPCSTGERGVQIYYPAANQETSSALELGSSSPSTVAAPVLQNVPINTQIPCAMVSRSFHFGIFTPFTRSHRQNDDSPINGGTRMAGIIKSANVGAKSAAKQAIR